MSAHHQLIRDCLSFTGPLDPLKGDSVYVAIQSTAKETIDNLFNESLRNRTNTQRPVDSFAGASVSSQSQMGMQGIGGGSRAPPAPKDDWLNRAKGTFGTNGQPPAQPFQPAQPAPSGPFGQSQFQPTGRYGAPATQPAQPAQPGPFAQPAQQPAPAAPATGSNLFRRQPAPQPAAPAAPVYTPPVIKAGSAVTDGSYERKLVEELCTPQGMRPEPPKDKLTRFANACQTLDASVVGPILLGKLSDKNWKVVMKALYTIQEILNTPNTDGFKAYFKENTEELQALGAYNHPMVKKMAGTVFDRVSRCKLGDEAEEEEEPEDTPIIPTAAPTAASSDFGFSAFVPSSVDFFGASGAQQPAAQQPAASGNDPFGFNAVSSIDDAFSGLSAQQPAKQPAASKPAYDFFSTPAPQEPAASKPAYDFFSTPAAPQQPVQQPVQQPAMNYGMPAQQPAQQPRMNYGMPAQQPAQQPRMNYGAPAQQPAMNYGMPAQQPAANYGMPAQQSSAMNFDFFGM